MIVTALSFLLGLGFVAYRLQPWAGMQPLAQPTRKPTPEATWTPEPAPSWSPTPPVWVEPPRPRPRIRQTPTPVPMIQPATPVPMGQPATPPPTVAPVRRRRPPGMYDPNADVSGSP